MDLRTFRILALLSERPLRAAEIIERLREGGDVPSIALFYRILKRELDEGRLHIEGTVSDGGPGRPQHVYSLTPQGREALTDQARDLRDLASEVLGWKG